MRSIKTAYRVACMRRGVPLPPPPDFPPLPTSIVDYWMSEKQCTPTEWISQISGIALLWNGFDSLPLKVEPDGQFYNTRPVGWSTQSTSSGSKWVVTGLPPFLAVGSLPWILHVGRVVSPASGQGESSLFHIGSLRLSPERGDQRYIQLNPYNGPRTINGVDDRRPHRLESWLDGTAMHLTVDGVDTSSPLAGGLTSASTQIQIGGAAGGPPLDATHAFVMICTSKPTDAERLALDNWISGYYGVP